MLANTRRAAVGVLHVLRTLIGVTLGIAAMCAAFVAILVVAAVMGVVLKRNR